MTEIHKPKKKLCCVFNTPSHYRELIYSHIENSYDCDWYFEETDNKLKEFDISKFLHTKRLKTFNLGPIYAVRGMMSILANKNYHDFLMMGHSRNISTFMFVIIKRLFYPSKKIYLWTHGLYGKESRTELLWKKLLLTSADELLIYGDYACNLMKNAGFRKSTLHAIHNSLDYAAHLKIRESIQPLDIYIKHFENSAPTLIFIGRLNPVKRLDMILHSISSLKQNGETYNIIFVGDGPDADKLKSISRELEIDDQVWFYGACYDERRNAELIFNADLCVAPGNIGLTSIHALTFGCPAITHNDFHHQMPEFEAITEGKTGMFFERGNQESLTQTIERWFKQENYDREKIRLYCYKEIDNNWNPDYQMRVLKSVIK